EKLAFTWRSGSDRANARPTLVSVTLADEGGGTRVTLVESGFGDGPEWDAAYRDNDEGWAFELDKLFNVVEGLGARGLGLTKTISLKSAPEKVWRAIATTDGIRSWWANGEIEARVGGRYR